jgi:hypothetical protein
MTTLILKKESQGYYSNRVNNIKIVVSEFNSNWTGIISNEDETDDAKYIIYKCFSNTKKQVIKSLVEKIESWN